MTALALHLPSSEAPAGTSVLSVQDDALAELGLTPGTKIQILRRQPLVLRVRDSVFCLRLEDAAALQLNAS
jgi:Fe2+ transport system protein FeoA